MQEQGVCSGEQRPHRQGREWSALQERREGGARWDEGYKRAVVAAEESRKAVTQTL